MNREDEDRQRVLTWLRLAKIEEKQDGLDELSDEFFTRGYNSLESIQSVEQNHFNEILNFCTMHQNDQLEMAFRKVHSQLKSTIDLSIYDIKEFDTSDEDDDKEQEDPSHNDFLKAHVMHQRLDFNSRPKPPNGTRGAESRPYMQLLSNNRVRASISHAKATQLFGRLNSSHELYVRDAQREINEINARNQNPIFLRRAFKPIDELLNEMQDIDNNHPLAGIVTYITLMLRALLCCWQRRRLHSSALVIVDQYKDIIARTIRKMFQTAPRCSVGELQRKYRLPNGKLSDRFLNCDTTYTKMRELHWINRNWCRKEILKLNNVKNIALKPNSQTFIVTIEQSMLNEETQKKSNDIHFRPNPKRIHKQPVQDWIDLIGSYIDQNQTIMRLKDFSPSEKIKLYTSQVHRPYPGSKEIPMSSQWLFMTDDDMKIVEQRRKEMSIHKKLTWKTKTQEFNKVATIQFHIPPINPDPDFNILKYDHKISITLHPKNFQWEDGCSIISITDDKKKTVSFPMRDIINYRLRPVEWGVDIVITKLTDMTQLKENEKNYYEKRFHFKLERVFHDFKDCLKLANVQPYRYKKDLYIPKRIHQTAIDVILERTISAEVLISPPFENIQEHKSFHHFNPDIQPRADTLSNLENRLLKSTDPEDFWFRRIFLLNHHLIFKNEKKQLLEKLEQYFKTKKYQKRVLELISELTACYPYDLQVRKKKLWAFLKPNKNKDIWKLQGKVKKEMERQVAITRRKEINNNEIRPQVIPLKIKKKKLMEQNNIAEYTSKELALMLYEYDSKIFSSIDVRELIGEAWKKKKNLAPNIKRMITATENRVLWGCSQILSHKKVKQRAQVVLQIARTAFECYKLGNWNAANCLGRIFETSAIRRLKRTWELVNKIESTIIDKVKSINTIIGSAQGQLYKLLYRNRIAEPDIFLNSIKGPITLIRPQFTIVSFQDSRLDNIENIKERRRLEELKNKSKEKAGSGGARKGDISLKEVSDLTQILKTGTKRKKKKHTENQLQLTEIPDFPTLLNDLYLIDEKMKNPTSMDSPRGSKKRIINFKKYVLNWEKIYYYIIISQVMMKENRTLKPFKVDMKLLQRYEEDMQYIFNEDESYHLSHKRYRRVKHKSSLRH